MQRSWTDIESFYLDLRQYGFSSDVCEAMAEFCRWMDVSEVSGATFGRTSLHTLMLAQTRFDGALHPSVQYLKIEPDFKTRKIEFRFIDTRIEDNQWSRVEICEGQALIDRFIGFSEQLGWM